MHYLHLTFFFCLLSFFSNDTAPSSPTTALKSIADSPAKTDSVKTVAANLIFQSKDGGQTWQDISTDLPANAQPKGFFAGESDLYVHVNNEMYRSKNNLKTPVWEKETVLDPRCTNIAFIRSGVIAYNYDGQVYQKKPSAETWSTYPNLKSHSVGTLFEASDGSVFLNTGRNLFKSADQARTWKLVQKGGGGDIVESEGVLLATGQNGIMRSSDNGEHWEWVISEGGAGFALERIDGGFAAITYSSSTKSRRIHISMDSGSTWTAIDKGLPRSSSISSIKQMGDYLICGHPNGIFRSSDMGKTWKIVHPGVDNVFTFKLTGWNKASGNEGKVFKIHASGNVLYAVAVEWGC